MTNNNSDKLFQLPDGRHLGYAEYGAESGPVLFYFHGLPGSRIEARLMDESAKTQGIRVIAIDRPGFGYSESQPARRILDWLDDVRALADHVNISHFSVVGVSGGGPFALACASALPDRIQSTGVVCGLGPVYRQDMRNQMPMMPRLALSLAGYAPRVMSVFYALPLKLATGMNAEGAIQMIAYALGDPDRTVLQDPSIKSIIAASLKEVFRTDYMCGVNEAAIHHLPWGFDLSAIDQKVHLWHGDQDNIVPLSHSFAMQSELQDAVLKVVPGEGHFSLPVRHASDIIATLIPGRSA